MCLNKHQSKYPGFDGPGDKQQIYFPGNADKLIRFSWQLWKHNRREAERRLARFPPVPANAEGHEKKGH